ncbi:MAG: acyl carrier protein [Imperialibacter sp.]|uniref:acyl carrier protein n=1 Tax=Imperialibacter sp. TaxID=2038411 RepID=UPI0030DBCF3E|tara:strand:- start:3739 stop:3966 length:228 start_codon:yes stop_codon:yes gene_type:complete
MEEKFIKAFKEALELEDRTIDLTDTFRDYEEWDSLGHLSLIAILDEEFGVVIEQAEFNKLNTVGELMVEVKKRMV